MTAFVIDFLVLNADLLMLGVVTVFIVTGIPLILWQLLRNAASPASLSLSPVVFSEGHEKGIKQHLMPTAIHEAGHAVVALTRDAESVAVAWVRTEIVKITPYGITGTTLEMSGTRGAVHYRKMPDLTSREGVVWWVAISYAGEINEQENGLSGGKTTDFAQARTDVEKYLIKAGGNRQPKDREAIISEGCDLAKQIIDRRKKLLQVVAEQLASKRVLTDDELQELHNAHP